MTSTPTQVPAWDAEMEGKEHCVEVPPTAAANFTNNSRWSFTALPAGAAPAGGWPVLIQLAIIPYPSKSGKHCGMDGYNPPGGFGAAANSAGRAQKRADYCPRRPGAVKRH